MDPTRQFTLPRGLGGTLVGALMAPMNATQIRTCVADLAPEPGEHILEIGFGPGIGLTALAETHPDLRIAGADPSEAMAAAARRRVRRHRDRIELRQATAGELPWPDGTFDAVCATNSAQLWQPLDESLLPALNKAGFADVRADWRPSKGARALYVRAVNPPV
jgi:ubiquinone/menaquinone biosynthesis C-methylase UbiE